MVFSQLRSKPFGQQRHHGAWDVSKCKQGGGETRQWWTARRRYLVTTSVLHHTLLKPRPAAAQCSGRQWSECFCQRQGIWFSSERPENATRTSAWQGKVRPLGVRTPEEKSRNIEYSTEKYQFNIVVQKFGRLLRWIAITAKIQVAEMRRI